MLRREVAMDEKECGRTTSKRGTGMGIFMRVKMSDDKARMRAGGRDRFRLNAMHFCYFELNSILIIHALADDKIYSIQLLFDFIEFVYQEYAATTKCFIAIVVRTPVATQ